MSGRSWWHRLLDPTPMTPPGPFPATQTGRQLYEDYRATAPLHDTHHHVVYLEPGDVITSIYEASPSPKNPGQLELFPFGPEPGTSTARVTQAGYLILCPRALDPGTFDCLIEHHLGWHWSWNTRNLRAVLMNGERLDWIEVPAMV